MSAQKDFRLENNPSKCDPDLLVKLQKRQTPQEEFVLMISENTVFLKLHRDLISKGISAETTCGFVWAWVAMMSGLVSHRTAISTYLNPDLTLRLFNSLIICMQALFFKVSNQPIEKKTTLRQCQVLFPGS
jgi:hypothetical protein